jgi:plastocyanin
MKRVMRRALLPVGLLSLLATGCGGSPHSPAAAAPSLPSSTGGQTLKLDADPSGALKFTTDKLSARPGKVTIQMTNLSDTAHSIAIEGNGVDKDSPQTSVGNGQTAAVTATLKPGTYTFYCPVDGHKQAGMKGTLTVR